MDKQSRKQQMRDWLNERIAAAIEKEGAVDTREVVNALVDFFSEKPIFMRELIEETFRPIAYQEARNVIRATRQEDTVDLGEEVVPRSEFERRAKNRFARWIENIKPGRDVRVMDMGAEDCRFASQNHAGRAAHEWDLSELFGQLGQSLQEAQVVNDVFSEQEVEKMYTQIKERRGAEEAA